MACHGFHWWSLPFRGCNDETRVHYVSSNVSSSISSSENSSCGYGFDMRDTESVKFPLKKGVSSSRKIKKKWHSREDRKIDREHDGVLVQNDGVCLSGSESEDSDWSIGWLEPHGPDFLSDDETDDSFAVLVPCYRNDERGQVQEPNNIQLHNAIHQLTNKHFNEGKNVMNQWLSSLKHF